MALISYNDFLALVSDEHIEMLSTFVLGQTIETLDPATADVYQQRMVELKQNGLCRKVLRGLEDNSSGQELHTFTGYVTEPGQAYVARAARERLKLSRQPLPEEPTP